VRLTNGVWHSHRYFRWRAVDQAAHWRRNEFATRLFTPAASGWYPKKTPQESRPVPVLADPWPGVPVRGRGAQGRAEACWSPGWRRDLDAISFGVILGQFGWVTASLVERMAPDSLWELFERVVPSAPERPQGGGRRRCGDREVLAAIIFVATSGCTWNQLPPGFGLSGVTAFRRFTEWSEARVWAKLHRLVLDELGACGELDWSRCAIDSVSVRALKGGG
jgi:transposase